MLVTIEAHDSALKFWDLRKIPTGRLKPHIAVDEHTSHRVNAIDRGRNYKEEDGIHGLGNS